MSEINNNIENGIAKIKNRPVTKVPISSICTIYSFLNSKGTLTSLFGLIQKPL